MKHKCFDGRFASAVLNCRLKRVARNDKNREWQFSGNVPKSKSIVPYRGADRTKQVPERKDDVCTIGMFDIGLCTTKYSRLKKRQNSYRIRRPRTLLPETRARTEYNSISRGNLIIRAGTGCTRIGK